MINSVLHALDTSSTDALRTVFLDRDGVINQKMPEGQYVRSWEEFKLLTGVPEAIARLNKAGLRVIVVSNQRGIALGLYSDSDVRSIRTTLQKTLAERDAHVDAFYFCPHDKKQCNCRKPLPGLFNQAAVDFPDVATYSSAIIGDSLSDIEFGLRLGMRTVFIKGDQEQRKSQANRAAELAQICVPNLPRAVGALLRRIE